MTFHFEPVLGDCFEIALVVLESRSFFSERDGCRVVLLGCCGCRRAFLGELEEAKRVVTSERVFLCLACDPDADVPALKGVLPSN